MYAQLFVAVVVVFVVVFDFFFVVVGNYWQVLHLDLPLIMHSDLYSNLITYIAPNAFANLTVLDTL